MCGACAGALAAPPWEVAVDGGTRRDLLRRAREAESLVGGRLRVRPFGPAGYQVTARTGRTTIHEDLDGLVRRLAEELVLSPPDPGGDGPLASGGDGPLASGGDGPLASGGDGPLASGGDGPLASGGDGPLASGGDGPLASGSDGPPVSGGEGPVAAALRRCRTARSDTRRELGSSESEGSPT